MIIATVALVMINLIRRDELSDLDPFDDATFCRYIHEKMLSLSSSCRVLFSLCRARLWLFVSYVVSFASLIAAVRKELFFIRLAPKTRFLLTRFGPILGMDNDSDPLFSSRMDTG